MAGGIRTDHVIGGRAPITGEQVPLVVAVGPDGTPIGGGGGSSTTTRRPILQEGTKSTGAVSSALASDAQNPVVNGNAIQLMAADANRSRVRVQNLGTATVFLRINPQGDATPAFIPAASGSGATQTKAVVALPAGGVWESPIDEDCRGLVSVCSATANQTVAFQAS